MYIYQNIGVVSVMVIMYTLRQNFWTLPHEPWISVLRIMDMNCPKWQLDKKSQQLGELLKTRWRVRPRKYRRGGQLNKTSCGCGVCEQCAMNIDQTKKNKLIWSFFCIWLTPFINEYVYESDTIWYWVGGPQDRGSGRNDLCINLVFGAAHAGHLKTKTCS